MRKISEEMDTKTATITTLEQQIEDLKADNETLHRELDAYVGEDGTLQIVDGLLNAASEYLMTKDAMATATYLDTVATEVNLAETSDAFRQLYDTLLTQIGPELAATYYQSGSTAYKDKDYAKAIEDLLKSVKYDDANGDAYFALGDAYRQNGQKTEAIDAYRKVIELLPGTGRANRAQNHINTLNEQ